MNTRIKASLLFLITMLATVQPIQAAEKFVSFSGGDWQLTSGGTVSIYVDANDLKGVNRAAQDLTKDIQLVCGVSSSVVHDGKATIVVGTLVHSAIIDEMAKKGVIDKKEMVGKNEKYIITSVDNQLIIAGSDRRGTIFGIYELSQQIGVSPWYWWADVPVEKHERIYIKNGTYTDGEPAVRYRGLFLNDEAPCLTSWVKNRFGTGFGGHEFYAHVFELILRLKGNMLWPAMWGWAFYADDPLNGKTADEMGVIIGTSHHEPMARNHQEWARHRREYGAWNYQTNKAVLDRFFREGIERMRGTEDIVTIGMRGDGDEAMSEEADTRLLQDIVKNQRKIISEVTKRPANETPQVWALYKEVLDYYDKGMRVPDDVIMLLCDDNWGNVRRVPTGKERKHKGGWGLYYHVDYVGAPRNSKWLNVTPSQNMWEQLTLAYENGIDRMWILNVGDLKPMEYPITLFMDMAWNPKSVDVDVVETHTLPFCEQQFGKQEAAEAARLLNLACKYNGRITAEMLDARTYNLENGEWERVVGDYVQLEAEALRQFIRLQPQYRDAYRELILFPIQAMGNVYAMYYAQAMNQKLAKEGNPDANKWAARVKECFKRDSLLCAEYNNDIAGGKWAGMMTQKHIGYTSWNDNFPADRLPAVKYVEEKEGRNVFVGENGCVVIEAEHYYAQQEAQQAKWTVIPGMGRTLSGMTLMPYTQPVNGASLSYRFQLGENVPETKSVKVRIVVKSTLDYLNKGGLTYTVRLDEGEAKTVNFNANLNEDPKNIYSVYYPTVAKRVVESVIELPLNTPNGNHTLTISPNDPAIVFEKIVIDAGGYRPSYLFGKESRRFQE
jgi:hypothetical protein